MAIAARQIIPEEQKTSIIRVLSYEDKALQGTFFNPKYGEPLYFGNLTRMLFLMEDLMDELNAPQAAQQDRRFGRETRATERATMQHNPAGSADAPVLATFHIRVLFRQGATWQGTITWAEAGKERVFRSVLELIKLMDSALPQPEVCEDVRTISGTYGV